MWSFIHSKECCSLDMFHKTFNRVTPEFYVNHLQKTNPQDASVWEFTAELMKKSEICCCPKSFPLVMLACYVLANKFLCDFHYDNLYTSRSGGVTLKRLNQLELEVMRRLHWINKE